MTQSIIFLNRYLSIYINRLQNTPLAINKNESKIFTMKHHILSITQEQADSDFSILQALTQRDQLFPEC